MASVDLVFAGEPLHQPVSLVFGDDGSSPVKDAVIAGELGLPALGFVSTVHLGYKIEGALTLPTLGFSSEVVYVSGAARPMVARASVRWQDADAQAERAAAHWADGRKASVDVTTRFENAAPLAVQRRFFWQEGNRLQRQWVRGRFQDARALRTQARGRFQSALRTPNVNRQRFEDALPVRQAAAQRFQDGIRTPNVQHTRYQDAKPLEGWVFSRNAPGLALSRGWTTRYQEAIPPRPGRTVLHPVEPPGDPCYIPDAHLVFETPWSADTNLVFVCDRHDGPGPEPGETVVVPVRRIYTVINSATLRRVDGDVLIPTTAMTLTIDVDSWTWGFTARTPGTALPDLEPSAGGQPVEVEARINGVPYRALIEGITRERVFGRSDLNVTGRGKAAVLDAPYTPLSTFGNPSAARTAQQLANDVLTLNGVSLGWAVNWAPEDWLVPAGVFSHQGSYMTALNAIAGAAGAYIQPHRTGKSLDFLLRYPAKPWEWGDVTPDYELPADVVQKEGVVWSDKAAYNRVFVRGVQAGVLGQVTRGGTAGDLEAPMVTDPLITTAVAARQRGLPVLADVGRQAAVSLRLPVLAETGIIPPGKFVRYVDGGVTRIGLVRSTSAAIERAEDKLTIWQTIGVETHVGL